MVCPRFHEDQASVAGPDNAEDPGTNRVTGSYIDIVAGRATDRVFREKGQDGGLVSGVLAWGLASKKWSSFVGYSRDERWRIVPVVGTDTGAIRKTCGSKYTYTSIVDGLSRLHESGLASKPFAIVGLPCHVAAIRNLERLNSRYVKGMVLCIGLFCSKAFSYGLLIENKLEKEMKISIADVQKMGIKRGSFDIEMSSGKLIQIPLKDLQDFSHNGCSTCSDFSAELADISVGGLGTMGWTIAMIRTKVGEEVIRAAESHGSIEMETAENFSAALGLLEKLSLRKHKQAKKNITELTKGSS
jgi:coenzyme F420 hydrogenase subunit beta